MTCPGACDRCPTPIVVSPQAFRRLASELNNGAQRLEFAIDREAWAEVRSVYSRLTGLVLDLVMCRTGDCPCHRAAVDGA